MTDEERIAVQELIDISIIKILQSPLFRDMIAQMVREALRDKQRPTQYGSNTN